MPTPTEIAKQKIGWSPKRTVTKRSGSHIVLERPGYANYVWAFHDGEEIGPPMLARISRSPARDACAEGSRIVAYP